MYIPDAYIHDIENIYSLFIYLFLLMSLSLFSLSSAWDTGAMKSKNKKYI